MKSRGRVNLTVMARFSELMNYQSSKDEAFIGRVSELLRSKGEALVLFRYARAAGSKEFLFVNDMDVFRSKLESLPVDTNVVVFGDRPLPLRGKVDSEFMGRAVEFIPEGSEFLILCLERTIHDYRPHHYWESFEHLAGETHAELIEALKEYCGREVAVGLWPPWPEQSDASFEAYVADGSGTIRLGPY
jgi:hypothetical protein